MQVDTNIARMPGLGLLGWAALILGLPIAALAVTALPNEYKATLGVDALDCDGPLGVYMFAVPALLLYGTGLIINGRRWRRPLNLIVTAGCLIVCVAVMANLGRAIAEDRAHGVECRIR